MKKLFIALSLFLAKSVFSQNITNTLGLGGVFKIKDASNDFINVTLNRGSEYSEIPPSGEYFKLSNMSDLFWSEQIYS